MNQKTLEYVKLIAEDVKHLGGIAYLTGGYVRDDLLERRPQDMDIEIFFLEEEEVVTVLSGYGEVHTEGNFGVFTVDKEHLADVEFTLPRTEKKVGPGHKDFEVAFSSQLTVPFAAARRDFTINAIYQDILTGEYLDPVGGIVDLAAELLRPVSEQFGDDALRILRGFRFVSQLGFDLDPSFNTWASQLADEYEYIVPDRQWAEWRKMILGDHFHKAIEWMGHTIWARFLPEVFTLIFTWHGVKTPHSEVHPEGGAYEHTLYALKYAVQEYPMMVTEHDKIILRLSVLLHDIGKRTTRKVVGDRAAFPGHEQDSADRVAEILDEVICVPQKYKRIYKSVENLVREHMVFASFNGEVSKRSVSRLAVRLHPANMIDWLRVHVCDINGRPPLVPEIGIRVIKMMELASNLNIDRDQPKKIVTGRLLIEHFDFPPGKAMGLLIIQCFEAQLEQKFTTEEEAVQYVRSRFYD